VSPGRTSNGWLSRRRRSSEAERTNVVASNPTSASTARSMSASMASRRPGASKTTLPLLM
jgi:hypothetical protein